MSCVLLHCIPMKILCELLCINHQALCSQTSMKVSPWQDRILQQATFRSWCWALPTSSEFNLHCKVVVDCGHHAGYELQENKECLPKCNKKESVSICDNYSQYQYMRIQSPERVLYWKQNPKHANICKSCSQFQKTSYQVMSWSKPLLNPIINDLLHDLSMLARMDRDGWRPCQRMRIYSHCPRLVVAQHIFIDFLLLMSGPEILLGCVKQGESKRFELALTLVSNNPALVFIKSWQWSNFCRKTSRECKTCLDWLSSGVKGSPFSLYPNSQSLGVL